MRGIIVTIVVLCTLPSLLAVSLKKDPGNRDTLRLTKATASKADYRVAVRVENDQELAAMDIPLRFGQPGDPITLDTVQWSRRVDGWYVRHAAIDNEEKTVILGLIAELGEEGSREPLATYVDGDPRVATLVFTVQDGFRPTFSTFTTKKPVHRLAFIYNSYDRHGRPHVVEFTPEFDVSLDQE